MNIRWTTDPLRIEWKVRAGSKWVGRTVSVTRCNLREHGVSCPAAGKPVIVGSTSPASETRVLRDR